MRSLCRNSGFALLEVMISMVVAMVGVLGVAGMQLLAISNTESARYQSLATMLASSMAAQMQANPAYWGTPAANITVNNTTITGVPTSSAVCVCPATATDCSGYVCSKDQMAYWDLKNFGVSMAAALPSAVGQALPSAIVQSLPQGSPTTVSSSATISCPLSTPMVCKVAIYWSENNITLSDTMRGGNKAAAVLASDLASGQATTHVYTTLVSIQP